ncbi:MAG: peptidyl-prolyl cis-trans isomerase [Geminicoccaceae bacterium]|nr:peptidyl-prolyl cis-trans isomerase [Geminicoccaceae bacterium]
MLDAMRRYATSWVVKAFLLLLVASFAIWGIGDVFVRGAPSEVVAEVGGTEIRPEQLVREAERGFRTLREQLGGELERSPQVVEGLLRRSLDRLVARRLVELHARELGIEVDPGTLARIVREQPAFQGPEGFDRQRFAWVLRELGLSEAEYTEQLAGEVLRARLVEAASGAVRAPGELARTLARHREERRRGRALLVPVAGVEVPEPDDATLEAWLEENRAAFTVPELRSVELVILAAEDLAEEYAPSEEELAAEYERRRSAYTTPEQRSGSQLLAKDRAVLEEAARRAARGESFQEIARALEAEGVSFATLGPAERGVLPEEIDRLLFSLAPGETGGPVESLFGWHLLRLERIEPERVRPFAEVRAELRRELGRRRAADRLPELADRLDDALAAGESLEEAARRLGARHFRLAAVDAEGRDGRGVPVREPALSKEMLAEIFRLRAQETSLVVHGKDDRYFVVRVESIAPARAQTLSEVRAAAAIGWKLAEQRRRTRERARSLLARAQAGESLFDLAREGGGLELHHIGPFRRGDVHERLGGEVVRALFAAPAGRPAPEPAPAPQGFAIVVADEILPAPEGGDPGPIAEELRDALLDALLAGYERALEKRYPVTRDGRVFARLVEQMGR